MAVQAHNALGTVGLVGIDEHVQHVRTILKNVIRAAPKDDAGAFIGQIQDDLALHGPQKIRRAERALRAVKYRQHGKNRPAGGVFAALLNEFGIKARLFGYGLDQLFIIIGNAETLGHLMGDGAAAAAKLAADGDNGLCHGYYNSLPGVTYILCHLNGSVKRRKNVKSARKIRKICISLLQNGRLSFIIFNWHILAPRDAAAP